MIVLYELMVISLLECSSLPNSAINKKSWTFLSQKITGRQKLDDWGRSRDCRCSFFEGECSLAILCGRSFMAQLPHKASFLHCISIHVQITLLHTLAQSCELVLLTISVGQFDSSKSKLTECIFSLPDTPPTKEYPLKELHLYTDGLANRY